MTLKTKRLRQADKFKFPQRIIEGIATGKTVNSTKLKGECQMALSF